MARRFIVAFLGMLWGTVTFGDVPAAVQDAPPPIEELLQRSYLDDYLANVVFGYQIVVNTSTFAARYAGNGLQCRNCHLDAGRRENALPLNVAGMFPKWRAKNGKRNGIGLRIRECFLYSLDGSMPSEDAPEVLAVAAYVSYLSWGQVIGKSPPGRGVVRLPETGNDPNPANGASVYEQRCAQCHARDGVGMRAIAIPPVWGSGAYSKGAGMNTLDKAAGFIWANMPVGEERSLSVQAAWDVAAFLISRPRPDDPREAKILKLLDKFLAYFGRDMKS